MMPLHSLKLLVKHLLGRDLLIRRKVHLPLEHYGNRYGDWSVPANFVTAESVVYSFGIGEDASWDLGLIQAKKCEVHGFDPTPKSLSWVKNNISDSRFSIRPWALADTDGSLDLWLPANEEHVSASCRASDTSSSKKITVTCRCLSSIMDELGHEFVDVLKMDIEGAEYDVIEQITNEGAKRIGVILIEFHHWMSAFHLDETRNAIEQLANVGFLPAWVSETGHELLFVRRQ